MKRCLYSGFTTQVSSLYLYQGAYVYKPLICTPPFLCKLV